MSLDPNTPVIVGIGFADQRCEDPGDALEAYELMAQAVERAAEDAGAVRLLEEADSLQVPQGFWQYKDPGRLIAERVGAKRARTLLASIGILQQTLFSRACRAIANGENRVAIVTGGDTKYRTLRATIAGRALSDTTQEDVEPDEKLVSDDPLWAPLEQERGLMMPVEFYAIMESALRHAQGLSLDEHRDVIADLYSGFSRIASKNPHAWSPQEVSAQAIRNPIGKNKMLAFPYTKLHNTQWNVDQASAVIFCSVAMAETLQIPRNRWVFPLSATESNHVVALSQRPELHRSKGVEISGEKALALAETEAARIEYAELYSCFPAAVQIFARGIGMDMNRSLTVTGGMPFAGGPLNNFVIQGTARMIEVLRDDPGATGLVSCVSGMIGKQGFGLYSTEPNPRGFQFQDVTREVASQTRLIDLNGQYEGGATVAGYTVMYANDAPARAVAICDLPDGARTVANATDPEFLQALVSEEFCGREVRIHREGRFSVSR